MQPDRTEPSSGPEDYTDPSPVPERDLELAEVCQILRDCGVRKVTVRYEGSGDSGCIEDLEIEPESARIWDADQDRLRNVAEGYCPDGYENNEGGYGTLTVYPELGLAELEHFDRYQDTEPLSSRPARLSRKLLRPLVELGVTAVRARFDGYGDSGQIEGIDTEPANIALDDALQDGLQDFFLNRLPSGWEINEGAFGTIVVDVATGKVTTDAYARLERDSAARVTRWKWRT